MCHKICSWGISTHAEDCEQILPFFVSCAGFQAFFPLTSSGLTDPPAHRHELPPPAPVRQQLCGKPPQWLHDGSAEADPSRFIHFLSCLPGHREAAAPEHPESDPGLGPGLGLDGGLNFGPGELPKLLLQCGEERSDGPERRRRCTRQVSGDGCWRSLGRKQPTT